MWIYAQSTGELFKDDDPSTLSLGYSGLGEGKNNPAMQQIHDLGPIPRGFWHIGDPEYVDVAGPHGPFVLPLTADEGTPTFGRSGFLIHGDSVAHAGSASHGCIIFSLPVRKMIAASDDRLLKVVA